MCVCVCVWVSQGGLFISYLFDEDVVMRLCAEECLCVGVCVCVSQSGLFIFSFFEEDAVLRPCAESSFFFASVCVCVASG